MSAAMLAGIVLAVAGAAYVALPPAAARARLRDLLDPAGAARRPPIRSGARGPLGPGGSTRTGSGRAGALRWAAGARWQGRAARRRQAALRADIAVAADLFAACLAAGSSATEAADAVAEALGGPVAEELRRVVALIRLGGDPARCWPELGSGPDGRGELAAFGRALGRSADSGVPAAPAVAAEAARARISRRLAADAAIARLNVYAAAPLGLCFLPAFVCLGIVPVVLGLGASVLAP